MSEERNRAPFQEQLLLPPADHYHSVKNGTTGFPRSLTEAKISSFIMTSARISAFDNRSFLDQIKYISGWDLLSTNFLTQRFV